MPHDLVQVALAALSLAAIALQTSGRRRLERWAPAFGLSSQPFWLYQAHAAGAWGMELVVVAYCALWARRLYMNLRRE